VDDAALEEILHRARRREPEALGQLVEVYSRRVFGLLYRLTGSRDAAEELLQETFLRVVRTIGEYEHSGKFEAWLFRIAANLARDEARRHKRRGSAPASIDDEGDADVRSTGQEYGVPDGQLLRQEAQEQLEAGLARLSDAEREIILLRHFSGLSFREVAEILGVPLGTALARAHRALNRLRAELGADG